MRERAEIGERHGVAMAHLLHITLCDIGRYCRQLGVLSTRPRREECFCLSLISLPTAVVRHSKGGSQKIEIPMRNGHVRQKSFDVRVFENSRGSESSEVPTHGSGDGCSVAEKEGWL